MEDKDKDKELIEILSNEIIAWCIEWEKYMKEEASKFVAMVEKQTPQNLKDLPIDNWKIDTDIKTDDNDK